MPTLCMGRLRGYVLPALPSTVKGLPELFPRKTNIRQVVCGFFKLLDRCQFADKLFCKNIINVKEISYIIEHTVC